MTSRSKLPLRPLTSNERLILFWADMMGPGMVAGEFYLGILPRRLGGLNPIIWKIPKCLEPTDGFKTLDSTVISRLVRAKYLQYCQPLYPKEYGYARGVEITELGKEKLNGSNSKD